MGSSKENATRFGEMPPEGSDRVKISLSPQSAGEGDGDVNESDDGSEEAAEEASEGGGSGNLGDAATTDTGVGASASEASSKMEFTVGCTVISRKWFRCRDLEPVLKSETTGTVLRIGDNNYEGYLLLNLQSGPKNVDWRIANDCELIGVT